MNPASYLLSFAKRIWNVHFKVMHFSMVQQILHHYKYAYITIVLAFKSPHQLHYTHYINTLEQKSISTLSRPMKVATPIFWALRKVTHF